MHSLSLAKRILLRDEEFEPQTSDLGPLTPTIVVVLVCDRLKAEVGDLEPQFHY